MVLRALNRLATVFFLLHPLLGTGAESGILQNAQAPDWPQRDSAMSQVRVIFKDLLRPQESRSGIAELNAWTPGPEAQHIKTPAATGFVPLVLETRYNPAAIAHLAKHGIMSAEGATLSWQKFDSSSMGPLPPLPEGAMVTLAAWWPVAGHASTPIPVWTKGQPARHGGSNGFLSWERLFSIRSGGASADLSSMAFAGRYRPAIKEVPVSMFHSHAVSDQEAQRRMRSFSARKLSRMVLGRELRGGDRLALVAMHLLVGNGENGIWGTIWWGDSQSDGVALSDRGATAFYRLDAATDALYPLESDGSAHRCFNPWLEGGLPASDHGAGVDSNCVSCHGRASFGAHDFLRVTRGRHSARSGANPSGMLWSAALGHHQQNNTVAPSTTPHQGTIK